MLLPDTSDQSSIFISQLAQMQSSATDLRSRPWEFGGHLTGGMMLLRGGGHERTQGSTAPLRERLEGR
jgi:hypothetical protein